jgi:hypothetical protein
MDPPDRYNDIIITQNGGLEADNLIGAGKRHARRMGI